MTTDNTPPSRHTGGLLVVILLGVVFLLLLALLLLAGHKEKPAESAHDHETLTVLPPSIRLRTEPNAKAPVVATAIAGAKLIDLEDHGTWVRVQDADGLTGWAERSTLERTAERDRRMARFKSIRQLPPLSGVVTKRTPLYAGPGIYYPVVGEMPEGQSVQVFTRDHDFYAVGTGDDIAYADIDSIDVTASGAPEFAVKTTSEASAGDQSTAPPPTETMEPVAPSEQPSMPPPQAPAPVPARADGYGVYPAVPPGGTQPEEVERVIPRYPGAARAAGVGGPVVIRGIVRKDGSIDNVEILRDLPYGLGDAARAAVEQWRFRPATYRGEPIDVYYTVTVNFKLR